MEDAHAIVLELDEGKEDPNTFFAVYDGHGGEFIVLLSLQASSSCHPAGSTVAKFAGQNVHKRLVTEESYKEAQYDEALKRAFLGTDEDLLASQCCPRSFFPIDLTNRVACFRPSAYSGPFRRNCGCSVGDEG
jgi:protein phosphatase 2C family protein 2/3